MPTTAQKRIAAGVPELMAPAGNLEAGYAALHFGADAVYLGLKKFSARADADNFSLEDLDRLTAYAHALKPRRKVFVALNTLILQKELRDVIAALADMADLDVDAVIVQDLGVFRLVRRHFPTLRLHASTQMAIHNLEGALTLQELGFHRITLARELTLEEIRHISRQLTVETEFFAHGALCYSYSGLCLISSMLMGRSGNRGRCAYVCRDRFRTSGHESGRFLFSMKDLATASEIRELCNSGVASLKIEGRKKSALYVAATVHYYRRLLDGKLDAEDRRQIESDIQTIFSRPWTSLHLKNPGYVEATDPAFVGHRGTPVGAVEAVVTHDGAHWLRFRAQRDIERFDGLQLELKGLDKPYGFSAEELMLCRGKRMQPQRVFSAKEGSLVEVLLPPHHPPIPTGITVYCSSSQAVKRRYRYEHPAPNAYRVRKHTRITVTLSPDGLTASASCNGVTARQKTEMELKPARQANRIEDAIRMAFAKTGATRFQTDDVKVENPGGLFVPISVLNDVRRHLMTQLEEAWQEQHRQRIEQITAAEAEPSVPKVAGGGSLKWSVKIAAPELLSLFDAEDLTDSEEAILDIGRIEKDALLPAVHSLARAWGEQRARIALPLISREWERPDLMQKIAALRAIGWTRWEAASLAAWTFLKSAPPPRDPGTRDDITCDWSVYAFNRAAARQLFEMGATRFVCSPEDSFENIRALLSEFGERGVVIVCQDTPLFVSDNCVRPTVEGAQKCPGPGGCSSEPIALRSSHGDRLVLRTIGCRTIVMAEPPLCWAQYLDDLRAAGAQHVRADFSWRSYSPADVRQIWRALRSGRGIPRTAIGNFERGLL